jgi:hypothetical protein
VSPDTPEITRFPRNGFTAYSVLSPATNCLVTVAGGLKAQSNPVELDSFRQLDTSNRCQNDTASPCKKRRSSCTPQNAHEVHLALRLPMRA